MYDTPVAPLGLWGIGFRHCYTHVAPLVLYERCNDALVRYGLGFACASCFIQSVAYRHGAYTIAGVAQGVPICPNSLQ